MHRILLLLLLTPFITIAQSNSEYILFEKNQKNFITHIASDKESYVSIAKLYGLLPQDLIACNPGTVQTITKSGDEIKIPLLSKNFFTWRTIKPGQGYEPVYFIKEQGQTKSDLLKRFNLNEESFDSWNNATQTDFEAKDRWIVGWIQVGGTTNLQRAATMNKPVVIQKKELKSNKPTPLTTPKEKKLKTGFLRTWNQTKDGTNKLVKQTGHFFSSLGSSFKKTNTKKTATQTTKQTITKTTPVQQQPTAHKPSLKDRWNRLVNGKQPSAEKKNTAHKPSLKERWSRLVNGKQAPADKKYTKPLFAKKTTPNTTPKTSVTPAVKNNKVEVSQPKPTSKKKSFNEKVKDQWQDFVQTTRNTFHKKPKANQSNPKEVKVAAKPVVKPAKNITSKPTPKPTSKPTPKPTTQITNKTTEIKPLVSTTTKTKPIIENNSVKNNSVVKEKEAGKEIVVEKKETTPVKIIEPETVQVIEAKPEPIKEANVLTEEKSKNEVAIESLELVNTKGGKASTFFSGPRGGKYYVVTNLVKRGQLVKVTNTSNGKFVMAEVLGPLPVHDLSKGLILKIGDNAKSILGISTATFNVKVNY